MDYTRLRVGRLLAILSLALALVVLPVNGSTASGAEPPGLQKAMQVQERNTARLMALPHIVGTAVGRDARGQLTVKVFAAHGGVAGIPANLEGIPVEVEVTGSFFAIPGRPAGKKPPADPGVDPTGRFDPVLIGVSVGNEFHCSAGTIGCRLTDGTDTFALSNVHVFDPWHYGDSESNAATLGERIVQPGRIDDPADDCSGAATAENMMGKVVGCVPIDFDGGSNFVDAAIAIVPSEGLMDPRDFNRGTPTDGYGLPKSEFGTPATIGLAVQKYGRSTGMTRGEVSAINATVNVGYVVGTATFVGQILIDGRKFLKPGDSGSLVVTDPDCEAVGLLFAGNNRGSLGIANPIDLVLDAFATEENEVWIDGEASPQP
jgi:hypothetical protein